MIDLFFSLDKWIQSGHYYNDDDQDEVILSLLTLWKLNVFLVQLLLSWTNDNDGKLELVLFHFTLPSLWSTIINKANNIHTKERVCPSSFGHLPIHSFYIHITLTCMNEWTNKQSSISSIHKSKPKWVFLPFVISCWLFIRDDHHLKNRTITLKLSKQIFCFQKLLLRASIWPSSLSILYPKSFEWIKMFKNQMTISVIDW